MCMVVLASYTVCGSVVCFAFCVDWTLEPVLLYFTVETVRLQLHQKSGAALWFPEFQSKICAHLHGLFQLCRCIISVPLPPFRRSVSKAHTSVQPL